MKLQLDHQIMCMSNKKYSRSFRKKSEHIKDFLEEHLNAVAFLKVALERNCITESFQGISVQGSHTV